MYDFLVGQKSLIELKKLGKRNPMKTTFLLLILSFISSQAVAQIEELDPRDPNIEETLKKYDEEYERATGKKAWLDTSIPKSFPYSCYQRSCPVFIDVNKATQTATLFVNGYYEAEWAVSTGVAGHSTPNFDRHPNGRIYDTYSSRSYPGGDYNGLGNMPYAVFIEGGYAIHGTPRGNWSRLGQRASHGCIRLHPDYGYRFNRLVRTYGIYGTWITVR